MRAITFLLLVGLPALAEESLPAAYFQSPVVRQGQNVLWHDPGAVETLNLRYGIGGAEMAPEAPFTFVDEDSSGTTPKVRVKDANGRQWVLKFGQEAKPDTFCTHLAWALGYYVEPAYFVSEGILEGIQPLERAREYVDATGHFREARFQLRAKDPKFLRTLDWSWNDNPFVGTPELNGLKVLMMLLSNWDDKDARDAEKRGTNTAIYQHGEQYFYFIDDWGGAMGHWGRYLTRSKWSAKTYQRQSTAFVALKDGGIHWGYTGQHTGLMTRDVKFGDIAWLLRYLGRITDGQLRAGLAASGASEEEAAYFVDALRVRIEALQQIASWR